MSKGFQGLEQLIIGIIWNKKLEHNTKRSVFKLKMLKNKIDNSFSKSFDWNRILHEPSSVFKFKEFKKRESILLSYSLILHEQNFLRI